MKKNEIMLSLLFLTAQTAAADPKHPLGHDLPSNVPVENREATTKIGGKHVRNIDIDYLTAKNGLATVIFVKSLSPIQCTVPQAKQIDFRSSEDEDLQWMIRHATHHGVTPQEIVKVIENSMKMWREKRADKDFDPKDQKKQLDMIKKYCAQLIWNKAPANDSGPQ